MARGMGWTNCSCIWFSMREERKKYLKREDFFDVVFQIRTHR